MTSRTLVRLLPLAAAVTLVGCWSSKIPADAEPFAPVAVEDVQGLTAYLDAAGIRVRYQDLDSTDYYRNPSLRRLPRGAAPDSLTRVVRVDILDFEGPGSCLVYSYDAQESNASRNRRPARYLYRTLDQGPPIGGVSGAFFFGRLEAVCNSLSAAEEGALRGLQAYAAP